MKFTIRDQRNGNWYWISRTVYQKYAPKIGAIGLALYNAYASYAFDKQEVFPSQTTIAKKLKITIPTLIKYDKKLVKYKLIHIYKREGKSNIITLLKVGPLKEVKGSPKPALGLPLKEVKTNNNKYNNKKEQLAKRHESNLLIPSNGKSSFNNTYAKKLFTIITKKGKMSRKVGEKRWAKEIRLLRTTQDIEKSRIREVIKWLDCFIDDEYTPKIYKAVDFREKFLRIEDAMKRASKKVKAGEAPTKYSVSYIRRRKTKK